VSNDYSDVERMLRHNTISKLSKVRYTGSELFYLWTRRRRPVFGIVSTLGGQEEDICLFPKASRMDAAPTEPPIQ